MARPQFTKSLNPRPHYLSIVYHKRVGETTWKMLHQGRVVSPNQTTDTQEYSRIGDKDKLRIAQSITTEVQLNLYVEDTWEEVARFLGVNRPAGGWTGNEVIQLDPTIKSDIMIENYDGVTASANLLSREYIYEFSPQTLAINLDAEGDARIADISGAAKSYYIIPEAGV